MELVQRADVKMRKMSQKPDTALYNQLVDAAWNHDYYRFDIVRKKFGYSPENLIAIRKCQDRFFGSK